MGNIVSLDNAAKLPSFLKPAIGDSSLTSALAALATSGYPVISIKGKTFSVVRNGKATMLVREIDGEQTPATYIDTVIVNASSHYSKTFYINGYTEGSKEKPDCCSNDGIKPDAQSPNKQHANCAACPKNAWGSGVNEKGEATNGKACADVMRLAVAAPDAINDPMLLRVPPASLKVVTQYAQALANRGIPVEGSITRIKFEAAEASPKLVLVWKGYVTEEQYMAVQKVRGTELVSSIVGSKSGIPVLPAEVSTLTDDDDDAPPPAKAEKPKAEKPKTEKAKPAPVASDDDDDAPPPPKTDVKSKASALAAKLAAATDDDDLDD
jgi:hypothetical protein